MSRVDHAHSALGWRLYAQNRLFHGDPQRAVLMQLLREHPGTAPNRVSVNLWRNHAFEPILPLLSVYAAYAGIEYRVRLSDYDDTLAFADHRPADLECVWLDPGRYHLEATDMVEWLGQRLAYLRSVSDSPIVVATWMPASLRQRLQEVLSAFPAIHLADLGDWARHTDTPLLDLRTAGIAGTPLSRPFLTQAAQALACRWWAACVLPPIKAIAVDLDETLHAGILAEAGPAGVELTPGHLALQQALRRWRARGVLLALVSRNEYDDVRVLFERRSDYPLRLADFDAVEVSWGAKSEALMRVAQRFNIGQDAIVFVDDNPGELYEVAARLPGVKLLHAQSDAQLTMRALELFPGLWRWTVGTEDVLRARDLAANAERLALRSTLQEIDRYYAELGVRIRLAIDPRRSLPRLASLSERTNQFNLALRRMSAALLAAHMDSPDANVAGISLSDRLSDSGIIGLIIGRREGETLVVEEICISCRALGRGLEDALILPALAAMPCAQGCRSVRFVVQVGPRNEPARRWLARLAGIDLALADGRIDCPAGSVFGYTLPAGISWIQEEE